MTMYNKLNNEILNNVRNRIVVSNLESEEKMKINKRKQVLSIVAVAVIMLTGGFFTVDAATDNSLSNAIKDTIKVIFVKDNAEKEIEGTTYTDSKGDTWVKYENDNGNEKTETDFDKSALEKENIKTDEKITEEETEINFENK